MIIKIDIIMIILRKAKNNTLIMKFKKMART